MSLISGVIRCLPVGAALCLIMSGGVRVCACVWPGVPAELQYEPYFYLLTVVITGHVALFLPSYICLHLRQCVHLLLRSTWPCIAGAQRRQQQQQHCCWCDDMCQMRISSTTTIIILSSSYCHHDSIIIQSHHILLIIIQDDTSIIILLSCIVKLLLV